MDWRAGVDRLIPYVILVVLGGVAVYVYLEGGSLTLDAITVLTGVAGGAVAAYFIYKSLEQEKALEFHGEEEVILESKSSKSYVVVVSIGEQDFPFEPLRVNIYLTNIGILCEPPGSGESEVFIPLDKITEFAPHQNGIRVRYVDINIQYAEVLLYVDDKNRWIQTLASTLNARAH
jgi:hypothetical protein